MQINRNYIFTFLFAVTLLAYAIESAYQGFISYTVPMQVFVWPTAVIGASLVIWPESARWKQGILLGIIELVALFIILIIVLPVGLKAKIFYGLGAMLVGAVLLIPELGIVNKNHSQIRE